MSYIPGAIDCELHAAIERHGMASRSVVQAELELTDHQMREAIARLRNNGYIKSVQPPGHYRAWWVVTSKPLPPDPLESRQIVRESGTVPQSVLARTGLVGLFAQIQA